VGVRLGLKPEAPVSNGVYNSGIFVVVSIKCLDSDNPIKETFRFHLPRKTLDALLSLRDRLVYNQVRGIPDENCEKTVKFHVKGVVPKDGFYYLLATLKKRGIPCTIECDEQTYKSLRPVPCEVVVR
jgi:hypothetical protein